MTDYFHNVKVFRIKPFIFKKQLLMHGYLVINYNFHIVGNIHIVKINCSAYCARYILKNVIKNSKQRKVDYLNSYI